MIEQLSNYRLSFAVSRVTKCSRLFVTLDHNLDYIMDITCYLQLQRNSTVYTVNIEALLALEVNCIYRLLVLNTSVLLISLVFNTLVLHVLILNTLVLNTLVLNT